MNYNGLPDCPNFGQLGQTPKLPIFPIFKPSYEFTFTLNIWDLLDSDCLYIIRQNYSGKGQISNVSI